MDRVLYPKDEKQTIYEIYRACRLCGAGAGYKMPIIQSVVDLDGDGIELKQKIQECVQIEVSHTDRMPPLICELCVDKVNEFYGFLDMCKQNNKRTRLRLGLPQQTKTRDSIDRENCILRVTEPVSIESDAEHSNKHKSKRTKLKNELDLKIKIDNRPSPKPEQKPRNRESRESSEEPRWINTTRCRNRAPTPGPKRTTRQNFEPVIAQTDDSLLIERCRLKRSREKERKVVTPPPNKKIRIAPEPLKFQKIAPKPPPIPEPVKFSKPGPKSMKMAARELKEPPKPAPKLQLARPASKKDIKPSPTPVPTIRNTKVANSKMLPTRELASKVLPSKVLPSKVLPSKTLTSKATPTKTVLPPALPKHNYCYICKVQTKTNQGFAQHNTKHIPNILSSRYACNACELWFPTVEETNNHHKNHRTQNIPYKCTRCYGYFKIQQAYDEHFANDLCLSVYEVPDAKCWECWRTFPTNKLMEEHKCAGEDGRPGGKCNKCRRSYALLKNLVKHESSCTHKKKGHVIIDPEVKDSLLPMQVRIARCDPLLEANSYVDASEVSHKYGLDSKCRYPYLSFTVHVKPEPSTETINGFKHMVSIDEDIKEEFGESYSHWDSDSDCDSQKTVDSLSAISLKTIFSNKCLGKVPKKKRVVKTEVAFDTSADDFDLGKKIDSVIDNLDSQTSSSNNSNSILVKNNVKDNSVALESESSKTVDSKNSVLDKNKDKNGGKVDDCKVNDVIRTDDVNMNINNTSEIKKLETVDIPANSKADSKDTENDERSMKIVDDNKSLKVENDALNDVAKEVANINDEKMQVDTNENDNDSLNIDHDKNERMNVINKEIINSNIDIRSTNKHDSKDVAINNLTGLNNTELNIKEKRIDDTKTDIDLQKDLTEYNTSKDASNHDSITPENNENFSKINEITNKILKESDNNHLYDDKNEKSDPNIDSISLSSIKSENGIDKDKFNVNDLSEDDRQLMAELDAQIGENDKKIDANGKKLAENEQTFVENVQKPKSHLIDDLIRKKDSDLKSLDLDSISDDEFNFDI